MKTNVSLRTVGLHRIIEALGALGVQYKIIDTDGTTYGEIASDTEKKKVRTFRHGFGNLRKYYEPYIMNLTPGAEVSVPCANYEIDSIQSGITSWGAQRLGPGTLITQKDSANNVVNVMRIF